MESRGFVFAPLVAAELCLPFAPVRKAGKLPGDCKALAYGLEYGAAKIEMQTDALPVGSRVVICDDLLATGGTLVAACTLATQMRLDVRACMVLVELEGLKGAATVPVRTYTLLTRP